jgi:two-component system sensor histidine kinase YesM
MINSDLFNEDLDSAQEYIFGTFTNTFEGRQRLVIIDTVNNARWRIVGVAFMDELMAGLDQYTTIMLIVLGFCIVITIVLALFFAYIKPTDQELDRLINSVNAETSPLPAE